MLALGGTMSFFSITARPPPSRFRLRCFKALLFLRVGISFAPGGCQTHSLRCAPRGPPTLFSLTPLFRFSPDLSPFTQLPRPLIQTPSLKFLIFFQFSIKTFLEVSLPTPAYLSSALNKNSHFGRESFFLLLLVFAFCGRSI